MHTLGQYLSKECLKKTTVPEMKLRRRDEALKENEENVEEEEEEDMEDLEAMALQFLAGYYHIIYDVYILMVCYG